MCTPDSAPNRSHAESQQKRAAAVLLLLGVIAYVLPTALHGNPPIEDTAATLEYVGSRSLWTLAHFANVAAVVMWACAAALLHVSGALAIGRGAAARMTWGIAAGAFAIYFSIHAVGLPAAADQLETVAAESVVARTDVLLLVLGSTAFVSQALVGTAVALLGVALIGRTRGSRIFGGLGAFAGVGWTIGALLLNFAVIVPFTVLTWVWVVSCALALLRQRTLPPRA